MQAPQLKGLRGPKDRTVDGQPDRVDGRRHRVRRQARVVSAVSVPGAGNGQQAGHLVGTKKCHSGPGGSDGVTIFGPPKGYRRVSLSQRAHDSSRSTRTDRLCQIQPIN